MAGATVYFWRYINTKYPNTNGNIERHQILNTTKWLRQLRQRNYSEEITSRFKSFELTVNFGRTVSREFYTLAGRAFILNNDVLQPMSRPRPDDFPPSIDNATQSR